jgi:UDP-glucose 4-epimerase
MKVLVTGGAGYIGSAVTEELVNNGYNVILLDNLQQGHRDAIPPEADFVMADICDTGTLEHIFKRFNITAVIHLAADSLVGESMTDPGKFFQNNVANGIVLLNTMLKHKVKRFVFSSSAAVYGNPETIPISEDHPKRPMNAYGDSKIMFERILQWYGTAYGLQHVSLRYFNAAGATLLCGELHHPETHLIPNVLKAALDSSISVPVFGTDYPTNDGSCIRDYIHVADIARAHLMALEKIDSLRAKAYNLGNGNGYSVLDVIETARRVTHSDIPVKLCDRRAGDPGQLVASSDLARTQLGWAPRFELDTIIESAWQWMLRHPAGYGSQQREPAVTGERTRKAGRP